MTRRDFTAAALCATACLRADDHLRTLKGTLTPDGLRTPDGQIVKLTGDAPTIGVLNDKRVQGMQLEITGEPSANGAIRILPIHKQGMFVLKGDKKLFVTYWCDVCSIRTYTPGVCLCCQDETQLDLREKLDF
ncbi:MAG: hypothetical protein JST93_23270 [Acidobacteria bacterium]|nr:hypothetical protein [Acidobacteriota bacterium]